MFSSPIYYRTRRPRSVSVLSPFLRHLNPGTVAFAMFVALALLSPTRGKEAEARGSALTEARKTEEVRSSAAGIQRHEFIAKNFGNKTGPNR
jgi:hypothetical protein